MVDKTIVKLPRSLKTYTLSTAHNFMRINQKVSKWVPCKFCPGHPSVMGLGIIISEQNRLCNSRTIVANLFQLWRTHLTIPVLVAKGSFVFKKLFFNMFFTAPRFDRYTAICDALSPQMFKFCSVKLTSLIKQKRDAI